MVHYGRSGICLQKAMLMTFKSHWKTQSQLFRHWDTWRNAPQQWWQWHWLYGTAVSLGAGAFSDQKRSGEETDYKYGTDLQEISSLLFLVIFLIIKMSAVRSVNVLIWGANKTIATGTKPKKPSPQGHLTRKSCGSVSSLWLEYPVMQILYCHRILLYRRYFCNSAIFLTILG